MAKELALLFLTYIVCQVGIPETIVSNWGPQFVSDFWSEFYKYIGMKLKLLTANYPQTDSQIEIINQYFNQWLYPYMNYYQDNWNEWIAIIDYQ